jgi:hypothetical protein
MSEALDETEPDGVSHSHKDEGNRWSSGMYRYRILRRGGDDNLWAERDQFGHEGRDPLILALRVTKVDLKILT